MVWRSFTSRNYNMIALFIARLSEKHISKTYKGPFTDAARNTGRSLASQSFVWGNPVPRPHKHPSSGVCPGGAFGLPATPCRRNRDGSENLGFAPVKSRRRRGQRKLSTDALGSRAFGRKLFSTAQIWVCVCVFCCWLVLVLTSALRSYPRNSAPPPHAMLRTCTFMHGGFPGGYCMDPGETFCGARIVVLPWSIDVKGREWTGCRFGSRAMNLRVAYCHKSWLSIWLVRFNQPNKNHTECHIMGIIP